MACPHAEPTQRATVRKPLGVPQSGQLSVAAEGVPLLCCCSGSVAKSCLTLRDPTDCSATGSSVPHYLQELLKFMSIESQTLVLTKGHFSCLYVLGSRTCLFFIYLFTHSRNLAVVGKLLKNKQTNNLYVY